MFGNNRKPLVVVFLLIALVGQLFASVVWACPMAEEHISLEAVTNDFVMSHGSMDHDTQNLRSLDSESNAANCCQDASTCTVAGCMGVGLMTSALESVWPAIFSLPLRSLVEWFAAAPPSSVYRPPIFS
ncbi:MAG: hypothetical protein COB51_08410 [Moraxellaceae bacterium]|nr:MAG: hypothetical protein COB51_08410 [Moraxellaceae bacterium]